MSTISDVQVTDKKKLWGVITASSVGTLIEWYDFYIFGSLATILATQFFPHTNPTAAFLSVLATFAAGFIVRPFGALVFGRIGDMIGRKYTFLLTLVLMGGSTFIIGLIPGYDTIGAAAPILVLVLRLVQGLALGGEYGGAATYVAEHAPVKKRGFYTSFIQTTASLGLFLSLGVILLIRQTIGVADFESWGWRIPFLLSAFLVGVSIFIRLRMAESPLFAKAKSEGKLSANPLKESFGKKKNLKIVLLALFGATAGQGVIWYTGQFYALTFIQKTMNVDFVQSNYIIAIALAIGTPFFILFGYLSDKIGRKYIMMAGMLLGVLLYRPIYKQMYSYTNLSEKQVLPAQTKLESSLDIIEGTADSTLTSTVEQVYKDGTVYQEIKTTVILADKTKELQKAMVKKVVNVPNAIFWSLILLVSIQVLFVTMVYGPIAAFLVELFPTKIRYTSMSLPYHIGNGVFGGLVPFIATRLVDATRASADVPPSDPFAGLWYPIGIAALSFIIGMIYLSNKPDKTLVD
ncbi:MAG: MFS transporter [Sphingobacteriaceae bacterium]